MVTPEQIAQDVARALQEDVGPGDITAGLIPTERNARARVITREPAVLCGTQWFTETFRQLDPSVQIEWSAEDGQRVEPDQELCRLAGPARSLVTGERTALNFLQCLSGTATAARRYVDAVAGTGAEILDTRKTLPGLRAAQKYAAARGGCRNHRMGLYDAFLIKENHIYGCGSITAAVQAARKIAEEKSIEVEVESLEELREALSAGADIVLLDNFTDADMRQAVSETADRAKLEASGNVDLTTIRAIAETGVDYISVGGITKHVQAVDLSMRFLD